MAPLFFQLTPRTDATSSWEFKTQWLNPSDVFSVLLILGGDVICQALAQLAGSGFTPVTFSFGWVAYSAYALTSAVGQNKLMPRDPDCKCKVINGANGYIRENSSWIIGRIVRDFEYWCDPRIATKTQDTLDAKWTDLKNRNPNAKRPLQGSLIVSIYQPSKSVISGTVKNDRIYWVGSLTMVVQLSVAIVPLALFGDWGILIITAGGMALSIATGLLPQWKVEKWACRKNSTTPYILTRGNGAQHAIVVLGNGHGLNLEDLAAGQSNVQVSTNTATRLALFVLFALWIMLLITAAGLKENAWFLLLVGTIGIMQNVHVAGHSRRPENFGIPLEFVAVYGRRKVMDTLLETERNYEGIGRALLPEFFPGTLTMAEEGKWDAITSMHRNKGLHKGRSSETVEGAPGLLQMGTK